MPYTVLSSWPRLCVSVFKQLGVNEGALLHLSKIDPHLLEDPNSRVRLVDVIRLWQLGAKHCGPDLPLHVARGVNASTFHALGFAMATSDNGYDALKRLTQYYPMITTAMSLTLIEEEDRIGIRLSVSKLLDALKTQDSEEQFLLTSNQMREAGALGLLSLCRSFFGINFTAQSLSLTRDLGSLFLEYQAFIDCELNDNAEYDEAWFSREQLLRPLSSANVHLARLNDQIVESYIKALRHDVGSLVISEIIRQLPNGRVTQTTVADALRMSTRTLQRKLSDNGQSFRQLLADTRRELALQYIQHDSIPILEIGYRLGFTEPANFTRAFKQWTGQPPAIYRQQYSAITSSD